MELLAIPICLLESVFAEFGYVSISTTRKYYLAVQEEDLITASKLMTDVLVRTNND
jgi:hypothetical protein